MTITSAMIFAAGFGTRMGTLTADTPKPMLPLAGRPMIDHSVELLRQAGIETIVANTHYLPETLENHLSDLGVTTLREDPILETGGGLRAALPALGRGPVITLNPDAVWWGANPVQELLARWTPDMCALLMLTRSDADTSDFSLSDGRISRSGPYRYTGLQILRPDRLNEIEDKVFSLNRYWDLLLHDGDIHGTEYTGKWADIGTRENLDEMNRWLQS